MKTVMILSLFVSVSALAQTGENQSQKLDYYSHGYDHHTVRPVVEWLQKRAKKVIDQGEAKTVREALSTMDLEAYGFSDADDALAAIDAISEHKPVSYNTSGIDYSNGIDETGSVSTTSSGHVARIRNENVEYSTGSNPDVNGVIPTGSKINPYVEKDPAYSGKILQYRQSPDEKAHTVGPSTNSQ